MTPPPIERYAGREQAYVKHFFLASYLESLVHKVSRSYTTIVYVDGYSGPWESESSDYADTSFGIALKALRTARASWLKLGRDVRMKAVLVEQKRSSYDALLTLQPHYPEVEIKPFRNDFRTVVDEIMAEIPSDAFAFILLDPKGWRIPIEVIKPLLRRPHTEVVFNFMFEFINRAASMQAPVTMRGLDELLPAQGWRAALAEIDRHHAKNDRPALRRRVLLDTFRAVLSQHGNYAYVAETSVMRPLRNSLLYALVYATRSSKGIEVFRDCQIKTLREQEAVRGEAMATDAVERSGQGGLFDTVQGFGPGPLIQMLDDERTAAEAFLQTLVPETGPGILWGEIWPRVLGRHTIRLTELKGIGARLRREGKLDFPNWEAGKKVPADGYRVRIA